MSATAPPLSAVNDEELSALQRMLEIASGFVLAFARVNHPELRERLVAELRHRGVQFEEFQLDPGATSGIGPLVEAAVAGRNVPALFVYGLEQLIDPDAPFSEAVAILNFNRDLFVERFPFPVVFWVPDFAIKNFRQHAIDFWTGRSGAYHFIPEDGDFKKTFEALTSDLDWELAPEQRRQRREQLQDAYRELLRSPNPDPNALLAAEMAVARSANLEANWSDAEQHWRLALDLAHRLDLQGEPALCLEELGDVARMTACYREAERFTRTPCCCTGGSSTGWGRLTCFAASARWLA